MTEGTPIKDESVKKIVGETNPTGLDGSETQSNLLGQLRELGLKIHQTNGLFLFPSDEAIEEVLEADPKERPRLVELINNVTGNIVITR